MSVDTGITQAQSGRTTLKRVVLPSNLSDYKQKYSQILLFEQLESKQTTDTLNCSWDLLCTA